VKSFAGGKLGFRFSIELQTAARATQPKRGHMNRGGTSGATLRFKVPGANGTAGS